MRIIEKLVFVVALMRLIAGTKFRLHTRPPCIHLIPPHTHILTHPILGRRSIDLTFGLFSTTPSPSPSPFRNDEFPLLASPCEIYLSFLLVHVQ